MTSWRGRRSQLSATPPPSSLSPIPHPRTLPVSPPRVSHILFPLFDLFRISHKSLNPAYIFFNTFFFFFLWLSSQHMEVPRPRRTLSCSWHLHHGCSNAGSITCCARAGPPSSRPPLSVVQSKSPRPSLPASFPALALA